MCGTVKMYNENYREADHYFSQIPARHPESKLAPLAIELAIRCKHLSTGGSDYDGRKTAEARKLVQQAAEPLSASWPTTRKSGSSSKSRSSASTCSRRRRTTRSPSSTAGRDTPGRRISTMNWCARRYPDTKYAKMAIEPLEQLAGDRGEGTEHGSELAWQDRSGAGGQHRQQLATGSGDGAAGRAGVVSGRPARGCSQPAAGHSAAAVVVLAAATVAWECAAINRS